MDNLHHIMILQYLVRFTGDLENQLHIMQSKKDLKNLDPVDIIDYIELRAAYQTAVRMERDIVNILSWNNLK